MVLGIIRRPATHMVLVDMRLLVAAPAFPACANAAQLPWSRLIDRTARHRPNPVAVTDNSVSKASVSAAEFTGLGRHQTQGQRIRQEFAESGNRLIDPACDNHSLIGF